MTRSKSIRVALMIAAAFAAGGCSVLHKGKKNNTPVLGQRIAVLTGENDVTVDPATASLPMPSNHTRIPSLSDSFFASGVPE